MATHPTVSLEPFLESGAGHPEAPGPTSYRAGYRCIQTGSVICWIEIPSELVEATVMSGLSISVVATPDGKIEPSIGKASDGSSEPTILAQPIDVLITQALTRENLLLETAGKSELLQLRGRLERSLGLVLERLQQC